MPTAPATTAIPRRRYARPVSLTVRGKEALQAETRRAVREAIAAEIESAQVLGLYEEAADAITATDIAYVGSVIDDVIRMLRED